MGIERKTGWLSTGSMAAVTLAALIGLAGAPASALARPPVQDGDNLLINGGFEYPYAEDFRWDGGGFIAHGWTAWWYNDPGGDYDAPEFKDANIEVDPSRVRDGVAAQQYFRPWARHMAGVYQRVNVTPGSQLRFSVWGHAWSTFCVDDGSGTLDCDPRNSAHGGVNPITMKIGIDPAGGTDAFSPSIVWSGAQAAYDNFEKFTVEAVASSDTVTVFVYSAPEWAAPVINVYWDNAVLKVIGAQPSTSAPPPTAMPGAPTAPAGAPSIPPTQPAAADGSQRHLVQPGETLTGIALAYGVYVQILRDLNALSSDTLSPGQVLMIRPAASPAPTLTPETPPATDPPASILPPTGQICLSVFEDPDANGLREADDEVIPGAKVAVVGSGVAVAAVTTLEESCFIGLAPGEYTASAEAPPGYYLTGLASVPVTLSGSVSVSLSFGAASEPSAAGEPSNAPPADGMSTLGLLAGGAGIILVASGAGLAVYFLLSRRSRGIS